MVRLVIFLFVISGLVAGAKAQPAASPKPMPKTRTVAGALYIKFKKAVPVTLQALQEHATGIADVDQLLDRYGVYHADAFDPNAKNIAICRKYGIDRMYVLYFQEENDVIAVAEAFRSLASIESVSPRYIFAPCYTPNDPRWNDQWGLKSGRMNFESAWNFEKGSPNTIIAILDGGVNYTHEDLEANLFINTGETGTDNTGKDKRSNGKDDDADGYKDNWRGWDLAGRTPTNKPRPDNDPMPDTSINSHGTMVAGCAAATADNGKGVAGAGFNCSFMPVKIGNDSDLYMGYEGMQYAATHGAKAIVCSWGGWESVIGKQNIPFLGDLVSSATELGSLIVAAAGNGSTDLDKVPFYPACFPVVLSVGATGSIPSGDDKAASFTDYGKIVDVFAPGKNIMSTTLPDINSYTTADGTSFSAPYVGGLVGLLATKYPDWTPKLITRQIVETCDNVVNSNNQTKYWGRVNAHRAVTEPTYPGLIITGYSIDGVEDGTLDYINKAYTLDVKFKNVVTPGSVTVTLLRAAKYRPNQSTATLPSMGTGEVMTGRFVFTRDSTDDGVGDIIRLVFYASDGNKYKDTLYQDVDITDNLVWQIKSVPHEANDLRTFITSWPNPADARTTVRFTLHEADDVRIGLIDMMGREVLSIPQTSYLAGMHEAELDVQQLPAGMYTYVLESKREGVRLAKRLVISR